MQRLLPRHLGRSHCRLLSCTPPPPVPSAAERPFSVYLRHNKNMEIVGDDLPKLLNYIMENHGAFNGVNWATSLSKFGRLKFADRKTLRASPSFHSIISHLSTLITTAPTLSSFGEPSSIQKIVHSLAHISKVQSRNLPPMPPGVVEIMAKVDKDSRWLVTAGDTQDVALTAWAAATLKAPSPWLFRNISSNADKVTTKGKPQEIANVAWAFAVLSKLPTTNMKRTDQRPSVSDSAPLFFESISANAVSTLLSPHSSPQAIANTAWAAATLSQPTLLFFEELEKHPHLLTDKGKPQELANTVWAFAKLQIPAPNLCAALRKHGAALVNKGKPATIANTAWAYAELGEGAPSLFREIEKRAEFLVDKGSAQEIADTVWAFARLQYDAPELMDQVAAASTKLIERGNDEDVANLAKAFAEIGHDPGSFFDGLEARGDKFVGNAKIRCICDLSLSLAILGLSGKNSKLLQALWRRATIETAPGTLAVAELQQLVYVDVHARASGVELPPVSAALKGLMEDAVEVREPNGNLRTEDSISSLLTAIGFEHEREVQLLEDYGSFMAIDFACKERKIAVEYDGRHHYLTWLKKRNKEPRENGKSKAKTRLMKQLGWTVVNMDYEDVVGLEDRELDDNEKEMKKFYLKERLEAVGVAL